MSVDYHFQIASADALMRHHDQARVHGYCSSCPHYGRLWSCPPFSVPPLSRFPAWDHAVLVCGKVWTERTGFEGREAGNARMIEGFQEARKGFRAMLLEVENQNSGTTALVAGHCQVCEECTRPEGAECRDPKAVRYSLEAVGFDVTGLVEGVAGLKILWPQEDLPDYLMTVGAMFCQGRNTAEAIRRDLEAMNGAKPE
jgi:predicted metal-binding protein